MRFKSIVMIGVVGALSSLEVFAQRGGLRGDDFLDLGPFEVRPFAEGRFGYDSNVLLDEDGTERDDTFFSAQVGLRSVVEAGPLRAGATVSYYFEEYSEVNEADDDDVVLQFDLGIGEDAEFGHRERVQVTSDINYGRVDEVDYETGNIEDRENLRAGVGVGKTFPGILGDVDAGYEYEDIRYRSGNLADRNENTVHLSVAPKLTDKTWGVVHGEYGDQSTDGAPDEDYYELRVGFKSKRTDKTTLGAQIGWIEHSTAADVVGFDVNAQWEATDKIDVALTAGNEVNASSSVPGNQIVETQAKLDVNYRYSDSVLFRTDATFTRNDLDQPLADGTTLESDNWNLLASAIYGPPGRFYNLFAEVEYETRDSSVAGNNYDQYITTLGLVLFY